MPVAELEHPAAAAPMPEPASSVLDDKPAVQTSSSTPETTLRLDAAAKGGILSRFLPRFEPVESQ